MDNIICLDSQILIWGMKKEATPGQENMIPKATNLLEHLDETGVRVLIPSIVVSELLYAIPPEKHSGFIAKFRKNLRVVPYDMKAAAKCALIYRKARSIPEYGEFMEELDVTRNHLKVDCMIIATAVANNVTLIYSEDKHIQKFSEGFISTSKIPTIPRQRSLFHN